MLASVYFKLGVIALIITGIIGFVWHYESLKRDLENANLKILSLNSAINAQNIAITEMHNISEKKLELARVALVNAQKKSSMNKSKAQTIYVTEPSIKGNDCGSALVLGNTE